MGKVAENARERSELIIHGASVAAGATAATSVLPGADAVAIMPIQIAMVTAVSREYGITPSASIMKSTIYASLGQMLGKAGSSLLLRFTPVAGNVVRGSVAFAVTEALGKLLLERLEEEGGVDEEGDPGL